MRLGIIADTHDRTTAIERAVRVFEQHDVTVVIHCGDINKPEMIDYFTGFEFHAVLGNNDQPYRDELDTTINNLGPNSALHGTFAELKFDDMILAVTHGVVEDRTHEYAESGDYDYVLHGHFHETEETHVGNTTIINPGAHRSVVVLDTDDNTPKFISLQEADTPK